MCSLVPSHPDLFQCMREKREDKVNLMAIGYKLCDKWFHGFCIKASKPTDYRKKYSIYRIFFLSPSFLSRALKEIGEAGDKASVCELGPIFMKNTTILMVVSLYM